MKDLERILAGLGGVENITEIEPCITRLHAELVDPDRVSVRALKAAGCHGVHVRGRVVQVVVGPEADLLATQLADRAWTCPTGASEPGAPSA